jgi:hypothetical protein
MLEIDSAACRRPARIIYTGLNDNVGDHVKPNDFDE